MSSPGVHPCPGCGRPNIANTMFACHRCWYVLPSPLRAEINAAYRRRGIDPRRHLLAMGEAVKFYRSYRSTHPGQQVSENPAQQAECDQIDPGRGSERGEEEAQRASDEQNQDDESHTPLYPEHGER